MNDNYMDLLFAIHCSSQKDLLIIEWENGLKIKCRSFTGIMENDPEFGDECYFGDYSIGVNKAEIIEYGTDNYVQILNNHTRISLNRSDNCVEIFNGCIEISLLCIPVKVSLEDGTVLWQKDNMDQK